MTPVEYCFGTQDTTLEDWQQRLPLPVWSMHQIHSDIVHVVTEAALPPHPPTADALVCALPCVVVAVRTGDCAPILLYNQHGVVAAVHAGRRGAFLNIASKTVAAMRAIAPKGDIVAYIGPCISQAHYAVGQHTYHEAPTALQPFFDDKYHFNLPAAVAWQLDQCGVRVDWQHYACTYQNYAYASHRRGDVTRQYSWIYSR